ncbi:MAG: DUF6460 domain-containing protein [Pseudomonadota bacterium]
MSEIEKRRGSAERVLGGSPLGVLIRLVILSFVVGLILRALDLNPADIIVWVEERIRALSNMGFETFQEVGAILVLGAVVVLPVWLLLRVFRLIGR